MLKSYQENKDWARYECDFSELMKSRGIARLKGEVLDENERICLLCSEAEADKCHRRLIAEFFSKLGKDVKIKHL